MRTVPLVVQGTPPVSGSQSILAPAGPHAEAVANLHWILTWGGAAIFLLVILLTAAAILLPPERRRAIVGQRFVAWMGLAFPISVLSALLVYSFLVVQGPLAAPPAKLRVEVVGEQWWWRVVYLDDEGKPRFETANEIRVPVGTPVEYVVKSADVIHSFWVPSLAGKIDMIPGRTNRIRFAASEAGVYRGQCAEYCGGTHALMALYVVVLSPAEFESWLTRESGPAPAPDGALAARGQALFLANGCGGCHAVRGSAAIGAIGPDLTHVGGRLSLAAGTLPNEREAFARWIAFTHTVKPEVKMPSFGTITGEDLIAVAAYLEGLE
jgi:cytochrome c oxidase subunit 2